MQDRGQFNENQGENDGKLAYLTQAMITGRKGESVSELISALLQEVLLNLDTLSKVKS